LAVVLYGFLSCFEYAYYSQSIGTVTANRRSVKHGIDEVPAFQSEWFATLDFGDHDVTET
jgi:hypothetical protein